MQFFCLPLQISDFKLYLLLLCFLLLFPYLHTALPLFLFLLQKQKRPVKIQLPVAALLIAAQIIPQFQKQGVPGTALHLSYGYCIFIYSFTYAAQQHLQVTVLYRQKFPVAFADQFCPLFPSPEIPLQPEFFAAAGKAQTSFIPGWIVPGSIAGVGVCPGCPAPHFSEAE